VKERKEEEEEEERKREWVGANVSPIFSREIN
jgi:hypothetical protein